MAKLSKRELAAHREAVALLERNEPLNLDQTRFVFENWHEGAGGDQTASSAFFTPVDMANDLFYDTRAYGSLIDLCAGTGRLAYFASGRWRYDPEPFERIVCVERNPAYVEIGRKLFPEAEWICGDALDPDLIRKLGSFDMAISNPPFGTTTKSDFKAPRYKGARIDLAVMDVAAILAPDCWAIVPENVATWDYRGNKRPSKHADAFTKATGYTVNRFSSVDPNYEEYRWRGTSPRIELVGFGDYYEEGCASSTIIHETEPPAAPALPATPQPMAQLDLFGG